MLFVVALTGCGRMDFAERAPVDAAPEAATRWGTPQPLTVLDTNDGDADPSVTRDELELYFSSDRGGAMKSDVYVTTRAAVGAPWVAPAIVGELSSTGYDDSPEISPDGLTLYLSSTREGGYQYFVSTRTDRASAWSTPVLVPELGGVGGQNGSFSGNGLVAVVEIVTDGNGDLYEHRRLSPHDPWGNGVLIAELSTPNNESSPALDEDGLTIYFTSNRPGTQGAYDIFTASRPSLAQPFGEITRVDEIDTPDDDGNPFLSRDGHTIYWASDRSPTVGGRDLWFATR